MGTSVLERYPHSKYPRLAIHLRSDSAFYQAITFLDGRQLQKSLRTKHLPTAFKLAEDWYQKTLRASQAALRAHPLDRAGLPPTVADVFASYRLTVPAGPKRDYADMRWGPIQGFWRTLVVSEVTPKTFREFYRWRRQHSKAGSHTIHKDRIAIRQVLKHAVEDGILEQLPMTPPVGAIARNPRPWLTPVDYKHLLLCANKRLLQATGNPKLRTQRQDLLDFMQFMVATLCRVDEARGVRFSDCRVVAQGKREVLVLQVSGKSGPRTVVAQSKALDIWKRRQKGRESGDRMFLTSMDQGFQALLKAAGIYTDATGFTRNFKSLRATAISFRLLEPHPNLLVIARNAGTSLQMIDQFYAKRLSAEMHLEELSRPSTVVDTRMGGRPATWSED